MPDSSEPIDRSPFVIHEDEVSWTETSHGEHYASRRKSLGASTRSQKIGCSLYEVPPGMKAFPYHYHFANEEVVLVLEGIGTLRLSGETMTIRAGDFIRLPVGPAGAHQITNSGKSPLKYYCLSTMQHPDICVYPDSKKYGLFAGSAPGGPKAKRLLGEFIDQEAKLDYWTGESEPDSDQTTRE